MVPGNPVADTRPAEKPASDTPLIGKYVTLELLNESHYDDLWRHFDDATWTMLPDGKPASKQDFDTGFTDVAAKNIIFAVIGDPHHLGPGSSSSPPRDSAANTTTNKKEALGFVGYAGDFNLAHRTLEAGATFGAPLRRSVAATEAHYLLLRNIFDPQSGPPYRRCSWKTNTFNTASRNAAQRLGYVFEGIFRNDQIDRGRSRDSAWFSIIDEDWPRIRQALELWLDEGNFDGEGRQRRGLQEIRKGLE